MLSLFPTFPTFTIFASESMGPIYFETFQSLRLTNIVFSIIHDSNDSIAQYHILPLQEYYSLLRKINKKQRHIFDDVMYTKKQKPEEPIHLFITKGAGTGKIFTLMLSGSHNLLKMFPNVHSILCILPETI